MIYRVATGREIAVNGLYYIGGDRIEIADKSTAQALLESGAIVQEKPSKPVQGDDIEDAR
jgi:hypothetical protein